MRKGPTQKVLLIHLPSRTYSFISLALTLCSGRTPGTTPTHPAGHEHYQLHCTWQCMLPSVFDLGASAWRLGDRVVPQHLPAMHVHTLTTVDQRHWHKFRVKVRVRGHRVQPINLGNDCQDLDSVRGHCTPKERCSYSGRLYMGVTSRSKW